MSIYATTFDIDAEDHDEDCAQWVRCDCPSMKHPGWVRLGHKGVHWHGGDTPCSCMAGPIEYQGSHILPKATDKRAGSVDLGIIPGFIGLNPAEDFDIPHYEDMKWPFLRLSVNDATVVLDERQVQELHEHLTEWLATEKRTP